MNHSDSNVNTFRVPELSCSLATSKQIRAWSSGEVRTGWSDGPHSLYSRSIFGIPWFWSRDDWPELSELCHQFGHIELALPVVHPLLRQLRVTRRQSLLALVLGIPETEIEKFLTGDLLLVAESRLPGLPTGMRIPQRGSAEWKSHIDPGAIRLETGPLALRSLLRGVDLSEVQTRWATEAIHADGAELPALIQSWLTLESNGDGLFLDVLPVIPWSMRYDWIKPNGFRWNRDVNELYYYVIMANNELREHLINGMSPADAWPQSGVALQQSVEDLLINHPVRARAVWHDHRRLFSVLDRARRTVNCLQRNRRAIDLSPCITLPVVPHPQLPLNACGIPRTRDILPLFAPALCEELQNLDFSVEWARTLIRRQDPGVWDLVDDIVEESSLIVRIDQDLLVLRPQFTTGDALQLAPSVLENQGTHALANASIYLPRTSKGRRESLRLLTPFPRIPSFQELPRPWVPPPEMVIALHRLTANSCEGAIGTGMVFASVDELRTAYDIGIVAWNALVTVRRQTDQNSPSRHTQSLRIQSTPGRIFFQQSLAIDAPWPTEPMSRAMLLHLVAKTVEIRGDAVAAQMIHDWQQLADAVMTTTGMSLAVEDLLPVSQKSDVLANANAESANHDRLYQRGAITDQERLMSRYDIWCTARDKLAEYAHPSPLISLLRQSRELDEESYRRLCCFQGIILGRYDSLTSDPPATESFSEGIPVLHYWRHARKCRESQVNTMQSSERTRPLQRRIYWGLESVRITCDDCRTTKSLDLALDHSFTLAEKLVGRTSASDIRHPLTQSLMITRNEAFTWKTAREVADLGLEPVFVRSPLFCEAAEGICRTCYGVDFSTDDFAEIGQPVGILAAQALGDSLMQSRTCRIPKSPALSPRRQSCEDSRYRTRHNGRLEWRDIQAGRANDGQLRVLRAGRMALVDWKGRELEAFDVPIGAKLQKLDGENVRSNEELCTWDYAVICQVSDHNGIVRLVDCEEGETLQRISYPEGRSFWEVKQHTCQLRPRLLIEDANGVAVGFRFLAPGTRLCVETGISVQPGTLLSTRPDPLLDTLSSRWSLEELTEFLDGGPKQDTAVLAPRDGVIIQFSRDPDGRKTILTAVCPVTQEIWKIELPSIQSRIGEERFSAGDRLTHRPINPQDVLAILGPNAAARHQLQELRSFFTRNRRLVNERHLEIAVRPMIPKPESMRSEADFQIRSYPTSPQQNDGLSQFAGLLRGTASELARAILDEAELRDNA